MSFRCYTCGDAQKTYVKPAKVVFEHRNVTYTHKYLEDTFGTEIVVQKNLCPKCNVFYEEAQALENANIVIDERD